MAQPARSAKTPTDLGLTANQVNLQGQSYLSLTSPNPSILPFPPGMLALLPPALRLRSLPQEALHAAPSFHLGFSGLPPSAVVMYGSSGLSRLFLHSKYTEDRKVMSCMYLSERLGFHLFLNVSLSMQLCTWLVQPWATRGWELPVFCWIYRPPL